MELLDITEFEDLLSLQAERAPQFEETPSVSTKTPLCQFLDKKRYEELKKETEEKYKSKDLPDNYFFSALSEIVLK